MLNVLNTIGRMFDGFSSGTPFGKLLIASGSVVTAIYSPIIALLMSCFAFTIVDMIYGIKVARMQKQKITSDRNWNGTLKKIFDEFVILSLARLLEYSVLHNNDVFIITGGVAVIISLTELWSILENLNTLNPNGPWRALGTFLKKKGEDYTGIEINLEENDRNDNLDHKVDQ